MANPTVPTNPYSRTYYGNTTDINNAKSQGIQGNFVDVSKYGDASKYQDLLHAYQTGANPVILGGAGATGGINDNLYDQLKSAGANVDRIGGADRYAVQNNLSNYNNNLQNQKYMSDSTNQINSMYDSQQASQLAALKAQQDKALGQLNQQKAELAPQYQSERNQADVVNAQNVQRLRELMAQNGLSASGENVTAQTAQNNQRLNSLNSLNLQEQQANNDINRQMNDVTDPAKAQAIINQIAQQRSQALLNLQNQAHTEGLQQQQNAFNNNLAIANLTGMYNGSPTMALQQLTAQQKQQASDNAWRQYQYNNMSASEKAQLAQNASQFGEDKAWQLYQLQYNGNMQNAQNQAMLDYYKNFQSDSKGSGAVPQSFQNDMAKAIQRGVPAEWAPVLAQIVQRESSYNPNAKNPKSTAYGYGQFLDSTRKAYEKKTGLNYNDPVNQLIMMAQYVKDRYGSPQAALQFWKDNQYY